MFLEWVLEPLDVLEDIGPGLLPGAVGDANAALGFQRLEDALHGRVVSPFSAIAEGCS